MASGSALNRFIQFLIKSLMLFVRQEIVEIRAINQRPPPEAGV